jgi:HEAT repeat protein
MLALALLGALGLAGWHWWPRRPPAEAPNPLHYLPDGCHFVVSVDVEALLGSSAHARLKESGAGLDRLDADAFRRALGVPLTEVVHLTAGGHFRGTPTIVLQTRREADAVGLLGGEVEHYRQEQLGRHVLRQRGAEAIFFADSHTVVRGDKEALRKALERDGPPVLSAPLQTALEARETDGAGVLVADLKGLRDEGGPVLTGLSRLLPALVRAEFLRLQVRAAGDVELTATVEGGTPRQLKKEAEEGTVALKRMLGLPRTDTAFLDEARLRLTGNRLEARLTVAADRLVRPIARLKEGRLEHWLGVLYDGPPERREEARRRVAGFGARAVPYLSRDLASLNADGWRLAALVLGDIGPVAASAVGPLVQALKDPEPGVRSAAAGALGRLGPVARARSLPALLAVLGDGSGNVRAAASKALSQLGRFTKADLPVLAAALEDSGRDPQVRLFALRALGQLDLGATTAIPLYAVALSDDDRQLRRLAVRLLGKMGRPARTRAFPLLVRALDDRVVEVRRAALEALLSVGAPATSAPLLLDIFTARGASVEARLYAAQTLGKFGPEVRSSAFGVLARGLTTGAPTVRRAVMEALLGLGRPTRADVTALDELIRYAPLGADARAFVARLLARSEATARATALPLLVRVLQETDREVRESALAALRSLGPYTLAEAPLFVPVLRNRKAPAAARAYAARVLGEMGPDNARSAPELIVALADDDRSVRRMAALALGQIAPRMPVAVGALTRLLDDPDEEVRTLAVRALRELRPVGGTLPGLVRALADNSDAVVEVAVEALAHYGVPGRPDVRTLSEALKSKRSRVRIYAADTLADLGPAAAPAVEALGEAMRDRNVNVRVFAALALRAVGPEASAAAASLAGALKDEDERVRTYAAATLVRLGLEPRASVRVLLRALCAGEQDLRQAATAALRFVGPKSEAAVAVLVQALEEEGTRPAAIEALTRIGRGAVPSLVELLGSSHSTQRLTAVEILGAMGPAGRPALKELLLRLRRERDPDVRAALKKTVFLIQETK